MTNALLQVVIILSCFLFQSYCVAALTTTRTTKTNCIQISMSSESNEKSSFKVLGVCGGIGSGKSSASKLLVSDLGCLAHLDADTLAHTVYSPGSQAVRDIVKAFGDEVLQEDNADVIDRKKLGAIVFADRAQMLKLEHIVWPHVKTELKQRIDQVRDEWMAQGKTTVEGQFPFVVLEAAVLLDAEWDDMLDGTWVVTTATSTALDRLMETRGLSKEEAEKRISAQESRRGIGNLQKEVDSKVVTAVIENNGTLDDLKQALQKALEDANSWK